MFFQKPLMFTGTICLLGQISNETIAKAVSVFWKHVTCCTDLCVQMLLFCYFPAMLSKDFLRSFWTYWQISAHQHKFCVGAHGLAKGKRLPVCSQLLTYMWVDLHSVTHLVHSDLLKGEIIILGFRFFFFNCFWRLSISKRKLSATTCKQIFVFTGAHYSSI